eukprot:4057164-Ditylum_brightwellii.AAC.1
MEYSKLQPPVSEHPMQTRLKQKLEQSQTKQQSITNGIETILSKGDPEKYNCTTNRNLSIINGRIRSSCHCKAPTFYDLSNPTTVHLQPSKDKPLRRSTINRTKSAQ